MECLKRKYLIKIKKQAQNFKEEYIDIKGIHIPFIGIFLLWLALYLTSEEKRLVLLYLISLLGVYYMCFYVLYLVW